MACGELQRDERADAAADDQRGPVGDGGEDLAGVVGVRGDVGRGLARVERVAGQSATVVGDDGEAVGEVAGERVERVRVAVAAGQEQYYINTDESTLM